MKIGGEKRILLDLGRFNFNQHPYMVGVWSHVVLFVMGYIASLLLRKPEPPLRSTSETASATVNT
jgi:SSS family solute:Na+ symporter